MCYRPPSIAWVLPKMLSATLHDRRSARLLGLPELSSLATNETCGDWGALGFIEGKGNIPELQNWSLQGMHSSLARHKLANDRLKAHDISSRCGFVALCTFRMQSTPPKIQKEGSLQMRQPHVLLPCPACMEESNFARLERIKDMCQMHIYLNGFQDHASKSQVARLGQFELPKLLHSRNRGIQPAAKRSDTMEDLKKIISQGSI